MSSPAPDWKITFADNTIGEPEIEAVTEVLRSRWLSAGPRTREFEREFAAAHGVEDAVAVNSGTAALHLAVLALGLGPGDEVIVPSLSFVASAAVTALQGATPVFADVRSEVDLTIDPADVCALITPRTRAIVGMHYGGYPADLVALQEIAREHGVRLIEDAAHAPAVFEREQALGTFGDIGCFSFFATKNVATGEGGMVLAKDPELLDRIRRTRAHSLTSSTWRRLRTGQSGYDVDGLGLNYRPTEIGSALGRIQLAKLAEDRVLRSELVAAYRSRLDGVGVPFAEWTGDTAYHLMMVTLPEGVDREEVRGALTAAGIQTSVHYPPSHLFSYYRERYGSDRRSLPVTESLAERLLSLPLHARMSTEDALLVADTLNTSLLSGRR
ncbi:DegT/DnrJ/EryC1/StrS family aminotransferase [Amycolatopsis sp. H20-H5]|uniref:DegT/DnrJ/EryC1/StrS family aminotransferase n=1 Tax=Amycolatopsis sp. H20-H5 TaxID=3046309 RepID=UPI002DB570CC|nr:DegT/DnrJ/EryC1/StrS family aminotransferase [Amycolatopsis sp. H20-H5]MEC3976918.1 DegT/DnrJ/EryC1/StrS family aminotransferase [Amycolatopsis sp. H20-H5]